MGVQWRGDHTCALSTGDVTCQQIHFPPWSPAVEGAQVRKERPTCCCPQLTQGSGDGGGKGSPRTTPARGVGSSYKGHRVPATYPPNPHLSLAGLKAPGVGSICMKGEAVLQIAASVGNTHLPAPASGLKGTARDQRESRSAWKDWIG